MPFQRVLLFKRAVSRSIRQKPFLSLEEFLFRLKVLKTYRDVMRVIYRHHERDELAKFVREEFKFSDRETDLNQRKYLLTLGINKINEMAKVFGISTNF